MAVTEQLNIRLAPGEKQQVADAARQSDSTVSDYVRQRLFGRADEDAEQALIEMLAEIKPKLMRAIKTIDCNLAEIQRLRINDVPRDPSIIAEQAKQEFSTRELKAVAKRLQLMPQQPAAQRRAVRR